MKGKGNFVSYNEKMMDEKKREIELKRKALLKEAKEVGISSKEVIEMMKGRLFLKGQEYPQPLGGMSG